MSADAACPLMPRRLAAEGLPSASVLEGIDAGFSSPPLAL
jgi:hypothetical protein